MEYKNERIGTFCEKCRQVICMCEEAKAATSRIENMMEALKLIKAEPGDNGKIKCPVCDNDLFWTRASSNKHVWGKCKTDRCLKWMQ